MTKQEELFLESIKNKINKYKIPTNLKEAVNEGKRISSLRFGGENILIETTYNDKTTEIVSPGIEWYLCSLSPLYFIDKYCFISVPNIGIIPFSPYYFQAEILKRIHNFKKVIYLKSRQCGISVMSSLYTLWRCLFRSSENIDVVSINQKKSQDFVSKMKTSLELLPQFLKLKIVEENKSRITFENKSQITSEPASENAGRSDTLSCLIMDELAFYRGDELAEKIVASAMPALTRTGGQLLQISTPNGMAKNGKYYYEQIQEAKIANDKDTLYIEVDWYEVPDIDGVKPEKGFNRILEKYIKLDYFNNPQVRRDMRNYFDPIFNNWRDNEWLSFQHKTLGSAKFEQEIGHNFVVMESTVLSKEYLDRIHAKLKDPVMYDRIGYSDLKGFWTWSLPKPGKRYIIGCLPDGEKVLTNFGLKNIEDIKIDDILINKDGKEIKIINKQITHNFNDFIYEIKLSSNYRRTKFTGEHPLLSSINTKLKRGGDLRQRYWDFNFKFNKVEDIKEGDWIIFPNMYKNKTLSNEEILNKWPVNKTRIDFKIENPLLDEDFWWYAGIWLAEGWTQNRGYAQTIHTAHNLKTEQKYKEKIINLTKKFNREAYIREKEENNSMEIHFSSKELFMFLNENFGKYAKNKKIPEWVKKLPDNLKLKLVEGYLNGDGSVFHSNNGYTLAFVSVSFELLEGIQDILYSLNLLSSLQLLRKKGTRIISKNKKISTTQDTYQLIIGNIDGLKLLDMLKYEYDKSKISDRRRSIKEAHFSDDYNYIYFRIKNINKERYKGTVYNFETEDHTYLCKNITTHNCDISKGTGRDTSCAEVIDIETYEQVAEYKGYISTVEFSKVVKKIAKFYNEAYVVIESNGIGEAVFNGVYSDRVEPYYNVFKQKKSRNNIEVMTGWITDIKTRQLITNNLIDWLVVDDLFENIKIYSSRLYEELTTWVMKDGRPDHADGGAHDDSIMAFALGLYNRNRAERTGDSFLVDEDGKVVELGRGAQAASLEEKGFGILTTESNDKNLIEEKYGMDIDTYKWLIG